MLFCPPNHNFINKFQEVTQMNDTLEVTQHIVEDWLEAMRLSVEQHDLTAHMALVSKNVHIYGLPNYKEIDYDAWQQRRKNEFNHNRLQALVHKLIRIRLSLQRRIGFELEEHMLASDGKVCIILKDVLLEREADDNWRVVEENIREWRNVDIANEIPVELSLKMGKQQHG